MPSPSPASVLLFTRFPQPGQVKTRLIPELGPHQAARLQADMTGHAVQQSLQVAEARQVTVWYQGGTRGQMAALFGPRPRYRPQPPGDLGHKMYTALTRELKQGIGRTVLVGTDCPRLSTPILDQALDFLNSSDLVLGPALDGGYMLLGVRAGCSRSKLKKVLANMVWSTPEVLGQTLRRARRLGLSVRLTPPVPDMDRPRDLALLPPGWPGPPRPTISVIVPTLNEGPRLGQSIASAQQGRGIEIIVVDGGSRDDTVDQARQHQVRIVHTRPGRGRQMNAGAAQATGQILLFLHADTELPFLYDLAVRQAYAQPGTSGGCFRFGLDASDMWAAIMQYGTNLRTAVCNLPYGDQALFLPASLFASLGGFPRLPLLEDVHLVRAMSRHGRLHKLPLKVRTSSRRWQQKGPLRTMILNQVVMSGYLLGIPERILARVYRPRSFYSSV